jgi:hypothetical protein
MVKLVVVVVMTVMVVSMMMVSVMMVSVMMVMAMVVAATKAQLETALATAPAGRGAVGRQHSGTEGEDRYQTTRRGSHRIAPYGKELLSQ